MDAVDIVKVCFRRWYVMLPILLGAAGVGYQLLQAQQTTYTAYASYALVPEQAGAGLVPGETNPNPLGANDGAVIGAALEAQLNSRETQQELGGGDTRGWGPGEARDSSFYSVEIPQFETTYEVRAWGEDEKAVREVVDRVIDTAPALTERLQDRAGAPDRGRYHPFVLAPTQSEALQSTSGKKLVVAVMGVGVLMGAAWSIVADRVLRQVRRRRAEKAADAATGPPPPDGDVRSAVSPPGAEPTAPPPESPPQRPRSRQEESQESAVPQPAEPEPPPRSGRERVTSAVGGTPRRPIGTRSPESPMTMNGKRPPNGKAARQRGQGAQQRRPMGGK